MGIQAPPSGLSDSSSISDGDVAVIVVLSVTAFLALLAAYVRVYMRERANAEQSYKPGVLPASSDQSAAKSLHRSSGFFGGVLPIAAAGRLRRAEGQPEVEVAIEGIRMGVAVGVQDEDDQAVIVREEGETETV